MNHTKPYIKSPGSTHTKFTTPALKTNFYELMRTRTSFTPATAPKGRGGSKHHTTRLKEAIGLTNFQGLIEYIEGEGAARFLEEIQALEGRDFIVAYLKMLEFVRPKAKEVIPDTLSNATPPRPVTVIIQRRERRA